MAINVKSLFPLRQARERRVDLTRYLRLDGGRYLIAAALLLALSGLLTLGQTGRLAVQGYSVTALETEKTTLMRESDGLLLRLADAQSLTRVEEVARAQGLRPATPDQVRYITIAAPVTLAETKTP